MNNYLLLYRQCAQKRVFNVVSAEGSWSQTQARSGQNTEASREWPQQVPAVLRVHCA